MNRVKSLSTSFGESNFSVRVSLRFIIALINGGIILFGGLSSAQQLILERHRTHLLLNASLSWPESSFNKRKYVYQMIRSTVLGNTLYCQVSDQFYCLYTTVGPWKQLYTTLWKLHSVFALEFASLLDIMHYVCSYRYEYSRLGRSLFSLSVIPPPPKSRDIQQRTLVSTLFLPPTLV